MFIQDPTALWESGADVALPPLGTRGVGVSWDGCKDATCADRDHAEVELACADYLPTVGINLCNILPDETRAYYSYDRGGCSQRVPLSDILDALVKTAVAKMKQTVAEGDPDLASVESHQRAYAQSAIWQGSGVTAEGGFQANLSLDVGVTGIVDYECYAGFCLPIYANWDADGNVSGRFKWVLDGGVLGVELLSTRLISASDDADVWLFFDKEKTIWEDLEQGLKVDVPEAIENEALARQVVEIPDTSGNAVPCDTVEFCASIDSGARAALALGIFASALSQIQKNLIRQVIEKPSEWIREDTCKMLIRGKRVNVYPDSIELVFREGGEYPVVRESAVELAADVLSKLRGTPHAMCDGPAHGKKLRLPFVRRTHSDVYD